MGIVTYVLWFLEPDRIRMLCLRLGDTGSDKDVYKSDSMNVLTADRPSMFAEITVSALEPLLVVDIFWCDGLIWRRNLNYHGLILTESWLGLDYLQSSQRARCLHYLITALKCGVMASIVT